MPDATVLAREETVCPPALACRGGGANGVSSPKLAPFKVSNRKLVVVVDDDPAMRRSLGRLLHQLGYDSFLFPSAEEAVVNLKHFSEALCALLDINLGGMSGIELKQNLDAAGVPIPVVYMTGNDAPAVREAALRSRCIAYLTKPFSAAALSDALQAAGAATFGRRS
jgi:FixJ family two-component response regulator